MTAPPPPPVYLGLGHDSRILDLSIASAMKLYCKAIGTQEKFITFLSSVSHQFEWKDIMTIPNGSIFQDLLSVI